MANYRAVATGNWSAGATWGGGAVPPDAAGHNIYSNGFTVTIDQNVNVALITNAAITATFVGGGTSAAVGGGFAMTTAYTLTGNVVAGTTAGATNCLTIIGSGNTTITATQIYGSNPFSAGGGQANAAGIINNSTGTLTISSGCSILSGTANGSAAIYNNSTGTINVSGATIVGGAGSSGSHGGIVNINTGIINVSGGSTLTGFANANNSSAIMNNGAGQVTITSCTLTGAGAGTSTVGGVTMTSAGTVTISNSTINASSTNNAVYCTAGTLVIVGCTMTATNAASAVNSSATNRFSGTFISATNGQQAVSSSRWILNTAPTTAYIQQALDGINAGSYVRFYTADNTSGITGVATTDVRLGVSYGGGLVGTCAVPNPGSVALGVPVDNTTGTATLTAANVRAALGMASANLDTQLAAMPTAAANATAVWAAASRTITGGTVTTLTNAPASVTPSDIWSHASRTLTSASGPSASDIRQEMDANSTKLANLDASVSSRLASSAYSAAPTTAQIATAVESSLLNEADGQAVLNAIVGAIGNTNVSEVSLVAAIRTDLERTGGKLDSIPTTSAPTAAANATAVWSAATKTITGGTVDTLTNSPSVPSAASIASATRSELATELGRLDAAVSTRLATSGYTAPSTAPTAAANASAVRTELATELAKVAALNTDRLANVATTAIVGNLIAQANS